VTGSLEFLKSIMEEDYDGAVEFAREAVEQGADIIDVCMDDASLDAKAVMTRFLNFCSLYPDIARQPVMIDSSRWEVLEAGLKCVQGKALVNSISLKEGEAELLRKARLIRAYGATAVVMLFDEHKIEAARRSYELLTKDGFPPEDIVFDPIVVPEADRAVLDGIRAHCPHAHIIAGDGILCTSPDSPLTSSAPVVS
jgi:5-methyltetrahydrofolate--homocysteine methyltransferase